MALKFKDFDLGRKTKGEKCSWQVYVEVCKEWLVYVEVCKEWLVVVSWVLVKPYLIARVSSLGVI